MNNHIFLGGTYNSTWRDKLISMLKCSYFNPIVPDWNKEAYQEELRQREFCDYCLYVITPNMTGMYSIAEAVDDSNKRPEKTIFCVLEEDLGDIPLTKFPDGVLSLVSDSFDLWRVLTDYLPKLKYLIISRNGKLVIRPDSGDPVDIICGKNIKVAYLKRNFEKEDCSDDRIEELREFYELKQGEFLKYTTEDYYTRLNDGWDWLDKDNNYWFGSNSENPEIFVYENKYFIFGKNGHRKQSLSDLKVISENEYRGLIELLWDIFGGTINEQGYKVLDPHIGMIYGEAINQDNIKEIFSRLESKGFAATNCFFGQGLK